MCKGNQVLAVALMSYGFGGTVVNQSVLFRQGHMGGACSNQSVGALPPRLQKAVREDRQQSQDGYSQKNRQGDVT